MKICSRAPMPAVVAMSFSSVESRPWESYLVSGYSEYSDHRGYAINRRWDKFATITKPQETPGEFLRGVRTAYGISQAELATRANTTQSAISRIESGKVSPSFETLRELLRMLSADLKLGASPRDTGVDLTLNERNLEISAEERVEKVWAGPIKFFGSSGRMA